MLRSVKILQGYMIHATDGDIGYVDDFYFDEQAWTIRYLVIALSDWLTKRRVLLSPIALGTPKWEAKSFPVRLTQEQVENSPAIDTDKPVSRQMEEELHSYYEWAPYWRTGIRPVGVGALAVAQMVAGTEGDEQSSKEKQRQDPHLRSVSEVIGYDIQASDGEIGHVDDFIADDETWAIRYIVVDTQDWLPGKKVLVSPAWIRTVIWAERNVHVDLSREAVKDSPEFDPSAAVNREYELRLYDYYGRPKYWTRV